MKTAAERSGEAETARAQSRNSGAASRTPRPYGLSFADGGSFSNNDAAVGFEAVAAVEPALAALPLARSGNGAPVLRRMCAGCDEDEQNRKIRRKTLSSAEAHVGAGQLISGILPPPGRSLDPIARDYLQAQRAPDFSGVNASPAASVGPRIQPQLEIGRVDDPLEIEADEMADHVVRRQAVDVDDAGDAPPVQAKAEGGAPAASSSLSLDSGFAGASGSGMPLAAYTRARMEESFDADFSAVRVHTGASSAGMCNDINARAFTYGTDIHFNEGEYAPGTERGTRLLAHELTHVVQQNGGVRRSPKRIQAKPAQLGPRVFGPSTGMPKGNLIHNDGLLPTFGASGLNAGLWIEPTVPGANGKLVAPGLWGKPDFYRDNGPSSLPIGINEAKLKAFERLRGAIAVATPRPPVKDGGPVRDLASAPTDIELGDVKPGNSGEEQVGRDQLAAYAKGIRNTADAVNAYQTMHGHPGTWDLKPGTPEPMKRLAVPNKLAQSSASGIRYAPLAVWEWIGTWKWRSATSMKGSCVVYKSSVPGIWAYEWLPISVPDNVASNSIQKGLLDRLETDVKPRLHTDKKPTPKLKQPRRTEPPRAPPGPARRSVQRKPKKHETFKEQAWLDAYNPWRTDAEKAANDPKTGQDEAVLDALMESKKRTGLDPGIPLAVVERAKDVATVRHWVRYGRLYGWFRKTFDGVYVKLAGFAQKVKDKVKKLSGSGGSSGFGNWAKAAALALFKVAKKLGAWAVSMIVDKLLDSLQEGVINVVKQLAEAATPEGVKSKIEEIEELKAKYEQMLSEAQESLEKRLFGNKLEMFSKLDEYMRIASTFATIVSVVKWGIRLVACASPPLIGCLWNLAIAALEYAFAKIMETCWFSAKVLGWIRDTGVREILNFPTQVAQTIASKGNEVLPLPGGLGPLFAPITIDHHEFKIHCEGGGSSENGGGPEPTEEQKALMELAKEFGDKDDSNDKLAAFLEMMAKRAADQNTMLDAERIKTLGPLIRNLSIEQMKSLAANQPTDGVPVSVEEFLKSIATHTPAETARKEARKIDYDKAQRSNPKFEQSQIKWKPQLFVREGIASDSKEFADAIYDIQTMLGIKPDGMAGPTTTKLFYEKNKQAKDGAYGNAVKLVEAAEQAAAEQKADVAKRKELEELLKDGAVVAALKAPFPSDEQLKKDLESLDWKQRIEFAVINGRAVVGIITSNGSRVGAYFHFVEKEFQKQKMKLIIKTSHFYAKDAVLDGDDISFTLGAAPDGSIPTVFNILLAAKQDSFFDLELFTLIYVDF